VIFVDVAFVKVVNKGSIYIHCYYYENYIERHSVKFVNLATFSVRRYFVSPCDVKCVDIRND